MLIFLREELSPDHEAGAWAKTACFLSPAYKGISYQIRERTAGPPSFGTA
jgi:hypothetical protein